MRKFFKYTLLIIILLICKINFQEIFDNRPFKFENFRTNEAFEEAVQKMFPVGSDLDASIKILEESGAKCQKLKSANKLSNDKIYGDCEYLTNLLSVHSLESYDVSLYVDEKNKIVGWGTRRVAGSSLIVP